MCDVQQPASPKRVSAKAAWLQTIDFSMDALRLDVWLDVACLFRTRSEAQKACKGGKVDVNGQAAKPHRDIRLGDEIVISRPLGRRQRVVVRGLAERHIARAEARKLYEDLTPPPTAEEIEMRRMARLARAFVRPAGAGAPDKRERRQLRKLKERT
jgi:ribosome-associated heat shock protein Hsp15